MSTKRISRYRKSARYGAYGHSRVYRAFIFFRRPLPIMAATGRLVRKSRALCPSPIRYFPFLFGRRDTTLVKADRYVSGCVPLFFSWALEPSLHKSHCQMNNLQDDTSHVSLLWEAIEGAISYFRSMTNHYVLGEIGISPRIESRGWGKWRYEWAVSQLISRVHVDWHFH